MTRLTYDPPFELPPPASQADSEDLRRVLAFYRNKGMDAHADYLQGILDDREGLEKRGGPGSGHFGHAGRVGEVGGSEPGEGEPRVARQRMPSDFQANFEAAIAGSPYYNHVSHHSVSELTKMDTTLLTEDGKAGVAVKNHGNGRIEATSLFNMSGQKGLGLAILRQAIEEYGVNYVEAYEPLNKLYETAGFRTTERLEFDRSLAPTGWDYEQFGEPNYHIMELPKEKPGLGGIFESEPEREMMIDPEIAAKFDRLLTRVTEDPDGLIAELNAELVAERGQEWFDANKKFIDAGWEAARGILGF